MQAFIIRLSRFLAPFILSLFLLLLGYVYYDPFKVLYSYPDYSYSYVVPNRDFISTEIFKKNYAKYQYNSFVFGSSRTLAFKPGSWKKHLTPDACPFMFDASIETIYGIYTKLKYLDKQNISLDNVLIVLCRDASFASAKNYDTHLYIKHPATSGESKTAFQKLFFTTYLEPEFLASFYTFTFTGTYKDWMSGFIDTRKITYDTITNEINILDQEKEIRENPFAYYKKRKNLFYKRFGERIDSTSRINQEFLKMLKEIREIFIKHRTNYYIVISPLYEQIKLNPTDLAILRTLFEKNLYDFSGKNSFTDSYLNYYETSHYRPIIGDSILNIIYH